MLCSYFVSKLYLKLTCFCLFVLFGLFLSIQLSFYFFQMNLDFLFSVVPLATIDLQSTLL